MNSILQYKASSAPQSVPSKMMQKFKMSPHQGLIPTDLAKKTIVPPVNMKYAFFLFENKNFVLLRLPPKSQEDTGRHGNRL